MVLTNGEIKQLIKWYEGKIESLENLKANFIANAEPLMDYELFEEQVHRYDDRIAVFKKRVSALDAAGRLN